MKSRKLSLAMICMLLFSLVLGGCSTQNASKESNKKAISRDENIVKIGVFEPMTGASAAGGEMTVEGIKLANELFGEVLGKKVELVIVDNKSDKVEAANAVSRLIEKEKVNAIIGSYGSSLSMAGGDLVKKAQVPAVGCSPTNPLVTLNNDYYFRVCFIDPFQGTVMANYAFNKLHAKKAAIIQDVTQDYAVGLSKYFTDSFKKLTNDDKSIVGMSSYNTGDQDFTAQLTNIKELNPDVIFAPGNYGESALLIKQARSLGIKVPILGGDTWEAPEFISIGGKAVEGAVFSTHFTAEQPVTDLSKKFLEEYKKKYNKDANAFAALGFDAYLVILDAIKKSNSADPVKIKESLAKTKDFMGSTGIITLDKNGDAVKSAVVKTVESGSFKYLDTVQPYK